MVHRRADAPVPEVQGAPSAIQSSHPINLHNPKQKRIIHLVTWNMHPAVNSRVKLVPSPLSIPCERLRPWSVFEYKLTFYRPDAKICHLQPTNITFWLTCTSRNRCLENHRESHLLLPSRYRPHFIWSNRKVLLPAPFLMEVKGLGT